MNQLSGCSCDKCIECCWRSPGWFGSIEEIEGAAKIKRMTVDDFINEYLIREWYYAESIEIPAPRKNFGRMKYGADGIKIWDEEIRKNGNGFVRASWGHNLMVGFACIFLNSNDECSIHESKPRECMETFMCTGKTISRQTIEDYWKDNQDWVRQHVLRSAMTRAVHE